MGMTEIDSGSARRVSTEFVPRTEATILRSGPAAWGICALMFRPRRIARSDMALAPRSEVPLARHVRRAVRLSAPPRARRRGLAISGLIKTSAPPDGNLSALESHPSPAYLHRLAQRRASAGIARIAQSVEHILGKDEVIGSIPIASFVGLYHLGGFATCHPVHEQTRRLR